MMIMKNMKAKMFVVCVVLQVVLKKENYQNKFIPTNINLYYLLHKGQNSNLNNISIKTYFLIYNKFS